VTSQDGFEKIEVSTRDRLSVTSHVNRVQFPESLVAFDL